MREMVEQYVAENSADAKTDAIPILKKWEPFDPIEDARLAADRIRAALALAKFEPGD